MAPGVTRPPVAVGADDIATRLAYGHETVDFEVKGEGDSKDAHFRGLVAKAAIAMGNRRDGGLIVIGVDANDLPSGLPGLTPQQLDSWLDYDTVAARLRAHMDPPLRFHPSAVALTGGQTVAVLEVFEFETTPHVCAQGDGHCRVLAPGTIYIRSRGKPESRAPRDASELREVLDLAISKQVANELADLRAQGLIPPALVARPPQTSADAEAFDRQQREVWQ